MITYSLKLIYTSQPQNIISLMFQSRSLISISITDHLYSVTIWISCWRDNVDFIFSLKSTVNSLQDVVLDLHVRCRAGVKHQSGSPHWNFNIVWPSQNAYHLLTRFIHNAYSNNDAMYSQYEMSFISRLVTRQTTRECQGVSGFTWQHICRELWVSRITKQVAVL